MWWLVLTMVGSARATEPADAEPATIDCSVHDEAEACQTAKARLATVEEALAELDCTKGRPKKQSRCLAKRSPLELEKLEITTDWAPPVTAPEEAAFTRGVLQAPPPPASPLAGPPAEMPEGKPTQKMEIDISDE